MALAKLLIFLAYNYQSIYKDRETEAADYLKQAAQLLQETNSLGHCALLFFCNCIELGFGSQVWQMLLDQVGQKDTTAPLSALRRVAAEKGGKLPIPYVEDMVKRIIDRLIAEYRR